MQCESESKQPVSRSFAFATSSMIQAAHVAPAAAPLSRRLLPPPGCSGCAFASARAGRVRQTPPCGSPTSPTGGDNPVFSGVEGPQVIVAE